MFSEIIAQNRYRKKITLLSTYTYLDTTLKCMSYRATACLKPLNNIIEHIFQYTNLHSASINWYSLFQRRVEIKTERAYAPSLEVYP